MDETTKRTLTEPKIDKATEQTVQQTINDMTISKFLDAAITQLNAQYTKITAPVVAKQVISEINASNTDADKDTLSRDEAAAFLKLNLANGRKRAGQVDMVKTTVGQACINPGSNPEADAMFKPFLEDFGKNSLLGLKFQIAAAKLSPIGSNDRNAAIKDLSAGIADQMSVMFSKMELTHEQKKSITDRAEKFTSEMLGKIEDTVKQDPALKKDLLTLPDITALGTLNANDACTAFLGRPITGLKK